MNRKLRDKVLRSFVATALVTVYFASTAFASCGVGCAAICRYTCQFTVTGSCGDEERDSKVLACRSAAFADTPGINDVPCGPGEFN